MTAIRLSSILLAGLMTALAPSGSPPGSRHQGRSPAEGAVAPDFTCPDWQGAPLSWSSFPGQPVLVFFHAPRLAYSNRAFSELLSLLADEPDLRKRVSVLLVLDGPDGAPELASRLADGDLLWRIAVDPDRIAFADYHVIAFPTAFCVTPERKVAAVVKGFGPLTAHRMVLGSRLAAGLLDRPTYERLQGGEPTAKAAETDQLRVRYMNLARKLLISGRVDSALAALLQAEATNPEDPDVIAVTARALLHAGRDDEAETRIEHLAEIQPDDRDVHLLRARLAIGNGALDAAREELSHVGARLPEARLLRGLLLEAEGRFEEAAEYHRDTVERLLWRDLLPEHMTLDAAAPVEVQGSSSAD